MPAYTIIVERQKQPLGNFIKIPIFINNHRVGNLKNGERKTFIVTHEKVLLSVGFNRYNRAYKGPFLNQIRHGRIFSSEPIQVTEHQSKTTLYEVKMSSGRISLSIFAIVLAVILGLRWLPSFQRWELHYPWEFLIIPLVIVFILFQQRYFVIREVHGIL